MSQSGLIDVESANPQIPTMFVTDAGTAVPIANTLELLGTVVPAAGVPFESVASGNTITYQIQYASDSPSSDPAAAGIASFDSAAFSVDANGFVTFVGSGGTEAFTVDTFSAPGTNPVEPDAGLIGVTGGQVAAGTTSNVIRTNSLAANSYAIQIQRSQAVASSTIGDNGVSHFNSAFFTVDGNGFVSLNGSAVAETITGNTGGALSPTAGNWNVLGASTAAGTTPVQTAGSGSTLTVQVQKSQAIASTNATNVGLAAFDSAYFGVDANGFVTLTSAAGGITTIDGDTGSATGSTITFLGSGTGLTFTASAAQVQLGGILKLDNGGTSANLTANNGGIFYSTATAGAILPGTATARQMLQSGATAAPAWSTATYPATTTANNLLYSSATNVVGQIATANNGVLITSNAGVPSLLPNSATPGYVLTANSGAPPSWQAGGGGGTYYSITPYVVGTDVNSQYTTIQAAINQAITDGASASNPKNIYIKPKGSTYTENLTAADGINLIGLSVGASPSNYALATCSVVWDGTLTWASGNVTMENISCFYSGVSTSITVPASGRYKALNCQFSNASGTSFGTSGILSFLDFDNCSIIVGFLFSSTFDTINIGFQNCYVSGYITVVGPATQIIAERCTFLSKIINNSASGNILVIMRFCYIDSANFVDNSLGTDSSNGVYLYDCNLNGSNPAFMWNTGTIFLQDCSGTLTRIIDDSYGSGSNTFSLYSCDFIQSGNDLLGANSQMLMYGCVGITAATLGSGAMQSYFNCVSDSSLFPNNSGTVVNSTDVNTSDSFGFLHLPTCAGTPVGTPVTYGFSTPIVYDSSAKSIWAYTGGNWVASGGGGGSYVSVAPYICGPTGDLHSDFTGDTAIADAIAQAVTDGNNQPNIYIKPGAYASAGFTIPSGMLASLIGLSNSNATIQSNTGVGPSISPTVFITGPITGTGSIVAENVRFQGAVDSNANNQFVGCMFDNTAPFTVTNNINCQFTRCVLSGTISSISNKYLYGSFDNCKIDAFITAASNAGDYFVFYDCNFTANSSIVNVATAGPTLEAYNCLVNSAVWIDESAATVSFSTVVIDGITANNVTTLFKINPPVNWPSINNVSFSGMNLMDDTAGPGGSSMQFNQCIVTSFTGGINLTDNGNYVFTNTSFSGTVVGGANTQISFYDSQINVTASSFGAGGSLNLYGSSTLAKSLISNTDTLSGGAVEGFLYIPVCGSTPSGTPTTYGASVPIVMDTSTGIVYKYYSGAWVPL